MMLCSHNGSNTDTGPTHKHTQPFYGPSSGTTRVSQCQKKSSGLYGAREDIRGRHTDNRLCATASGVISDPPPSSSHFYVGCHSCCNPPWLGTGTKYAGLYTQAISELFTVTSQMVLGVKFAIPELLCCLDCDSLPFVMCLLYTHTYFQYTSTFHVSRRRHEIYIGHTSLSVCVCPLLHAHTTAWTQNQV